MEEFNADILIRDSNGNTIYLTEVPGLPYESFSIFETHISSSGTLVVTVALYEEKD